MTNLNSHFLFSMMSQSEVAECGDVCENNNNIDNVHIGFYWINNLCC